MPDTLWEPGTGQPESLQSQLETLDQEPQSLEPQPHESQEPPAEQAALTMSVDDFAALEDRIVRAVDLVKRERAAKAAAEEHARHLENQLHEQAPRIDHLENELHALKSEREHVRQRVERLLAQLDALEL